MSVSTPELLMYHSPPNSGYLFSLMVAVLVAGCSSTPAPAVVDGSDTIEARRLLTEAANSGPVTLIVLDEPGGMSLDHIADAIESGIRGVTVRLLPVTNDAGDEWADAVYVAYIAGTGGGPACGRSAGAHGRGFRLALCHGERSVAVVASGPDAGPVTERELWQASARLFPDDYVDSYGFGWFGDRISLGVGMGF
ncbi:MAG: hypothetical protein R3D03_01185 [Geminicoccaceae bacterium]